MSALALLIAAGASLGTALGASANYTNARYEVQCSYPTARGIMVVPLHNIPVRAANTSAQMDRGTARVWVYVWRWNGQRWYQPVPVRTATATVNENGRTSSWSIEYNRNRFDYGMGSGQYRQHLPRGWYTVTIAHAIWQGGRWRRETDARGTDITFLDSRKYIYDASGCWL